MCYARVHCGRVILFVLVGYETSVGVVRIRDMATAQRNQLISRSDFDSLLTAFLALDRTVVEFYMQIYRTPPEQQAAMRRQTQRLHGVIRERVPKFVFTSSHAHLASTKRT